ncbi:unnamed protein product [Prorocentrum cordatum]|uniref:Uncharacterized protein n=1 Tax=Prorocentrum cordatum TaxID=2364126 RepID=A0ABN9QX06_9DINO|nr:unnamed protein product [Polarella glacialis]
MEVPLKVEEEFKQRMVALGKALLLHWRADGVLGAHRHRLGDALRALHAATGLSEESLDTFKQIKKQGDLARHLPLRVAAPGDVESSEKISVAGEDLRATAPSFVLGAGCWLPLPPPVGMRCTRGAVVYSTLDVEPPQLGPCRIPSQPSETCCSAARAPTGDHCPAAAVAAAVVADGAVRVGDGADGDDLSAKAADADADFYAAVEEQRRAWLDIRCAAQPFVRLRDRVDCALGALEPEVGLRDGEHPVPSPFRFVGADTSPRFSRRLAGLPDSRNRRLFLDDHGRLRVRDRGVRPGAPIPGIGRPQEAECQQQ